MVGPRFNGLLSTTGTCFSRVRPMVLAPNFDALSQNCFASSNLRSVWNGLPVVSIWSRQKEITHNGSKLVIVGSPHIYKFIFEVYPEFWILRVLQGNSCFWFPSARPFVKSGFHNVTLDIITSTDAETATRF